MFASVLRRPADVRIQAWVLAMTGATLVAVFIAAADLAFAQSGQSGKPQYEVLPVPAVTIYPGDIIADGMLTEAHFLPGTLAMYPVADSRAAVIGKVARRTLMPDRLISMNAIAEPELVARGSMIRVIFQSAGLDISANMLALEGGALGKFIQVRNIDSGRVVTGIVQADGTVRLGDGT